MQTRFRSPILMGLLAITMLPGCVIANIDGVDVSSDIDHYVGTTIEGQDLPFSKAVRVGDTIYLSGEIAIDPATNAIVPGGVGAETRQIFTNMERTLDTFDAGLGDIVKCTVFLDDMAHYGEMNAAYAASLPSPKPARATVAVSGLAIGASLEIECIAVTDTF